MSIHNEFWDKPEKKEVKREGFQVCQVKCNFEECNYIYEITIKDIFDNLEIPQCPACDSEGSLVGIKTE